MIGVPSRKAGPRRFPPNPAPDCVKMFGPIHWTADFVSWMLSLPHLGPVRSCYTWPFVGRRPTVPTFHTVWRCSRRRRAARKIGAIQKSVSRSTAFPIYQGGAADAQGVRPRNDMRFEPFSGKSAPCGVNQTATTVRTARMCRVRKGSGYG